MRPTPDRRRAVPRPTRDEIMEMIANSPAPAPTPEERAEADRWIKALFGPEKETR